MRDLGAIEETEVHRREVELPDFLQHMADSLSILFQNTQVLTASPRPKCWPEVSSE